MRVNLKSNIHHFKHLQHFSNTPVKKKQQKNLCFKNSYTTFAT